MAERSSTTTAIAVGSGVIAVGVGAAEVQRRVSNARQLGGRKLPDDGLAGLTREARRAISDAPARLDSSQLALLRNYSSYQSVALNAHARTGEVRERNPKTGNFKLVTDPGRAAELGERYRHQNRTVAAALDHELPRGTIVFRGTGTTAPVKPGDIITDPAVTSTSTSRAEAERFAAARKGGVTLVIDAGGAKGMSLEKVSEFASEREIALKPNQPIKVEHVARVRRHIFDRGHTYAFAKAGDAATMPATSTTRRVATAVPRAAAIAGPAAIAAAGAIAFDAAQSEAAASGATPVEATINGVAAGGTAAGIAAGVTYAAGKVLTAVGQTVATAAPRLAPLLGPVGVATAAGIAAHGAVRGYQQTGTVSGAAVGAVTGGEVPESWKRYEKANEALRAGRQSSAGDPASDGMTDAHVRRTKSGKVAQVAAFQTPQRQR